MSVVPFGYRCPSWIQFVHSSHTDEERRKFGDAHACSFQRYHNGEHQCGCGAVWDFSAANAYDPRQRPSDTEPK